MKWGRSKKHDRINTSPAPSPLCPLLSSWFSKFKKSDHGFPDTERDEYGEDKEFWRMSFGKDENKFPPSVCRSCLSVIVEQEEEGAMMFNEMVSNVRRMRELEPNSRAGARIKTGLIMKTTAVPRRLPSGYARESSQENRQLQRNFPRSSMELKSPRRRSRQVKVRSPRLNTAAVNFRRSKKGRGSSHRERSGRERDYERCALVKCSYDPQGDFRVSMMEMITARGIGGTATDMEELLACYLILNDDAYHDVIIKVFRQVWFELDLRGFWATRTTLSEKTNRGEPCHREKID